MEWRDLGAGGPSFDLFGQLPDSVVFWSDGFDLGLPHSDFFRLDLGPNLGCEGVYFPLGVGIKT